MNLFTSSSVLLNLAIKTKIKQIFLSEIDSNYRVDELWLEQAIDILIYTFNAKTLAANEIIELSDDEVIDKCVEVMVLHICERIQFAIPKVNAKHYIL
ncbi:hypothetical protein HYO12_20975 [Vibrio parahaemolyticus]|nr:hypothetical protein [Vibrio parahaemolyticus]